VVEPGIDCAGDEIVQDLTMKSAIVPRNKSVGWVSKQYRENRWLED
jgi:hypothetical protein